MHSKIITINDANVDIYVISESKNEQHTDLTIDTFFYDTFICSYDLKLLHTHGDVIYTAPIEERNHFRKKIRERYNMFNSYPIELRTQHYKRTLKVPSERRIVRARIILSDTDYGAWKREETINKILE